MSPSPPRTAVGDLDNLDRSLISGRSSKPTSRRRRALPIALLLASISLSVLLLTWDSERLDYLSLPFLSNASSSSSPTNVRRPSHHLIDKGLLTVDLSLPATHHPVLQLIERGRERWKAKRSRQSRTLKEAVEEYKRRNGGRNPPKGFDNWWEWITERNVNLPDEFDRINIDLAPFRSLSPSTLRSRISALQKEHGTFTLSNRAGTLSIHSITYDESLIGGAHERAQGQLDLVNDVAGLISDFDAVFNIEDTPRQFICWETRRRMIELGERDQYIDEDDLALGDELAGWGSACPPDSSLRQLAHTFSPNLDETPLSPPEKETKSFVADLHEGLSDLCQNLEAVHLHGALNGVHPVPSAKLMPMFSLSKTNLHSDILVCPTEQFGEDGGSAHWIHKTQDRLLWRGRTTGGLFNTRTPWRSSHRARLARLGDRNSTRSLDVLLPPDQDEALQDSEDLLGETIVKLDQGVLNERMTDIGLAYEPVQCNEKDGTCAAISAELPYRKVLTFAEEDTFRYIMDVDGNAWSARFKRILNSRALIFKTTSFVEFWNDRIEPYVHFIPVKTDYSDLFDLVAFFRGVEDEPEGQGVLAYTIGQAGHDWSATHWRKDDMSAYMFRLYLEYARLWSADRSSMDFVLEEES